MDNNCKNPNDEEHIPENLAFLAWFHKVSKDYHAAEVVVVEDESKATPKYAA